jgi:ribosomal protein S12 methylthiotransferase
LQHIADPMLKKMNRGSSSRYIYRLIDSLRKYMPDMVLRTTFIVGHPGETKKDFQQLEKFIRDTEFDNVGIFTYSQEEGTPSHDMGRQVPEELKKERRDQLMQLQKEISLKKNRARIGQTLRVLHEGVSEETDLLHQGRFYGQAPEIDGTVLIRSGNAKPGTYCDVKIVDAFEYDLLGEIVGTKQPAPSDNSFTV